MFSTTFWIAAGERAAKTFAQALLAALTMTSAPVELLHTNLLGALSVAGGATLLSVLTSLAGISVGADAIPGAVAATGRYRALPPVPPVTPSA